jgi:hypothetical protein
VSETKWTPGPLSVQASQTYAAEIAATTPRGSRVVLARITTPQGNRERATANAQLFASAPDLYAALDEAFQFLGETFGNPDSVYNARAHEVANAARAALARARGEET